MSEENRFNRPLVVITACYITGIVLGRFWIQEPFWAYWMAGLLLLPALGAVFRKALSGFMAVLLTVVAAAGAAAFVFAYTPVPGGLLEYAGSPVYIEGTVVDEPVFHEDHAAYRLRVETVETKEGRNPVTGDLLVKIYGGDQDLYWFGERLRLRGTIVEPRGQRNPGGFDYRFYLRSQGIDALVYPRPLQVSSLGPGEVGRAAGTAFTLRTRMVEGIEANLPSPAAELLIAILFGQRHRLPAEIEENFRRSGAGHLMAVSGLHVGLAAALILGLWRRLGLRGRLPLLLAIILVFAYAYLTGMRPSAMRAAVMVSMALGALILDRERDMPTAVALAALSTLVYNPLLLFTVGFQLSYAATLSIIYLHRPLMRLAARMRIPSFVSRVIAVTLAAQVGVLPLITYHFHHLPLGALFFNMLLLPLMALVVGLGLAGALFSLLAGYLALPFFLACRPLLELMAAVTGLARLPGIYAAVHPPGIVQLVVFYGLIAAALAVYYRGDISSPDGETPFPTARRKLSAFLSRPARVITVLVLAAVLLVWAPLLPAGTTNRLAVTYIDVGQGAAALVESPCGLTIMIDAGGDLPFRGEPGLVGERVLLPFLRSSGISHIDLAVISHPHEDHFGGFLPLLDSFPVGGIFISPVAGESPYYELLLDQAAATGIPVNAVTAGQSWSSGTGLVLEILGPPDKLFRGTGSDLNNNSIVMRLSYGAASFLFCGDIEDAAVRRLLREETDLRADILLVPHHGGYLESMPQFLKAVQPRLAVIPVGPNPFGHPHPFVLQALEEAAVPVYRNDHHGAVIVRTDGETIWIEVMETEPISQPGPSKYQDKMGQNRCRNNRFPVEYA